MNAIRKAEVKRTENKAIIDGDAIVIVQPADDGYEIVITGDVSVAGLDIWEPTKAEAERTMERIIKEIVNERSEWED